MDEVLRADGSRHETHNLSKTEVTLTGVGSLNTQYINDHDHQTLSHERTNSDSEATHYARHHAAAPYSLPHLPPHTNRHI
jgi:hypothetical protein